MFLSLFKSSALLCFTINDPFEQTQTQIHKTFYWWCFVDDEMMLLVVVVIVAVAAVRVDADVLFSASIKVEFQLNCFMI